ncbi:MAG: PTS sugar transporter subunit IIA [Proteobacteria bacterium]|nr:PTS sugar transporter subunit IIA [Pseudomonadota bacterium]
MLITDFLKKECINVDLQAGSKEEIIKELAELLLKYHPEIDKEEAYAGLFEREKLLSTGIGEGVAIPHARLESSRKISVAFGLVHKETDFGSLDNKPVKIVFLIFFPKDEVNLQLRFLARVSRLLRDASLYESLYESQSPEEVVAVFKQYEDHHFH